MYVCVCEKAYRLRAMKTHPLHVVRCVSALFIIWSIVSSPSNISPLSRPLTEGLWAVLYYVSQDAVLHRFPTKIVVNQFCVTDVLYQTMFFYQSSAKVIEWVDELLVWGGNRLIWQCQPSTTAGAHVQGHLWWWREKNCTHTHTKLLQLRGCVKVPDQNIFIWPIQYGIDVIRKKKIFMLLFFYIFLSLVLKPKQNSTNSCGRFVI